VTPGSERHEQLTAVFPGDSKYTHKEQCTDYNNSFTGQFPRHIGIFNSLESNENYTKRNVYNFTAYFALNDPSHDNNMPWPRDITLFGK